MSQLRKIAWIILAVALVAPIGSTTPANAINKSPVTVVNGTTTFSLSVPTNLVWSEASKAAATQAIEFQRSEIEKAIAQLSSKGAIKIQKRIVKPQNVPFSDWKDYLPSLDQYKLVGFNFKGKVVGTSNVIPSDGPNFADRLVVLEQSECTPANSANSPKIPVCSITVPKPEKFLRAALRASMGNGQLEDLGGFLYQQLYTCLIGSRPFTVKGGVFDCPSNASLFGGNHSFNLVGDFATRHYKIDIDSSNRRAKITYSQLDLTALANTATYDSGSVVRFG